MHFVNVDSSALWDSSTMSSNSPDMLDISTTEETDNISTTDEEDVTTNVQADEILQSTTNAQPSDSADSTEFLTTQEMAITTEEIDFYLLPTTESGQVEKWMDETTAITPSSDDRLGIANQPIKQPPISSEYTPNEHISTHATTSLPNSQNYISNQNITASSTGRSTNDLQISTTDDSRLISTSKYPIYECSVKFAIVQNVCMKENTKSSS